MLYVLDIFVRADLPSSDLPVSDPDRSCLLPSSPQATYHDVQVGVDDKGASALVYTAPEVTAQIGGEHEMGRLMSQRGVGRARAHQFLLVALFCRLLCRRRSLPLPTQEPHRHPRIVRDAVHRGQGRQGKAGVDDRIRACGPPEVARLVRRDVQRPRGVSQLTSSSPSKRKQGVTQERVSGMKPTWVGSG